MNDKKKITSTFIPNRENINFQENELKKMIGKPVWDHPTKKINQIGIISNIRLTKIGYYVDFEIFDDDIKTKINDNLLKGISIGGRK